MINRVCLSALFVPFFLGLTASAQVQDWQAYVAAERGIAEDEVHAGALVAAGARLAASLRVLPQEDATLADAAWPTVQFLLFTMEYLMDDEVMQAFLATEMNPEDEVMDRCVLNLYDIYIGQEEEGKGEAARSLVHLAAHESGLVKVFSLYILSDPYYFDNESFVNQHSATLIREFPFLDLTQNAVNLPVYEFRKTDDPTSLESALKVESMAAQDSASATVKTDSEADVQEQTAPEPTGEVSLAGSREKIAWSTRFQERAVAAASLLRSENDRREGVELLLDTAVNDADWRTRFGSLLVVEGQKDKGFEEEVKVACRQLAPRANVTPDVVRARILLAKLTAKQIEAVPGDLEAKKECLRWSWALVNDRIEAFSPERSLHEDSMKAVKLRADGLAKVGFTEDAVALLRGLAAQYPNSLVSKDCEMRISLIKAETE